MPSRVFIGQIHRLDLAYHYSNMTKQMKKLNYSTIAMLMLLAATNNISAQTLQNEAEQSENADETGLNINEVRILNRIDRVEVEHDKNGWQNYFDLNDPSSAHEEGSLTERGAMRTWRFKLKP